MAKAKVGKKRRPANDEESFRSMPDSLSRRAPNVSKEGR